MMYVVDFRGDNILKDNARLIAGKYYEKNKTCFEVNGLWYRYNVPSIIYDHATQKYRHVSEKPNMYYGVVDTKGEFGYFTPKKGLLYARVLKNSIPKEMLDTLESDLGRKWFKLPALNEEILQQNFTESLSDGVYYKTADLDNEDKYAILQKSLPKHEKVTGIYNLEDDPSTKHKLIDSFNSTKFELGKESRKFAKLLPYTWGIEQEITNGFLPERIRTPLGIRGLRDGSVNTSGMEYVTVPYGGARGIEAMKKMFFELSKRCEIDYSCSLHIHFGSTRKDKAYILSLYRLCYLLQDELINCFPIGRQINRNDGKLYCQKLPDLGFDLKGLLRENSRENYNKHLIVEFNKIYKFLNNYDIGHAYHIEKDKIKKKIKNKIYYKNIFRRKCYTTKEKTSSHAGKAKYDVMNRYYWVNFMPLLFAKQETVEFRLHEPTLNFTKSFNWLCTCTAILEYAKDTKRCLTADKISLKEVIKNHFTNEIGDYISEYWKVRKNIFTNPSGIYKGGATEIEDNFYKTDSGFSFNHNGIKNIV